MEEFVVWKGIWVLEVVGGYFLDELSDGRL